MTISGNVISDTTFNIDLLHVMDVAIAANNFFAPKLQNIRVAHGNRVVLQGRHLQPEAVCATRLDLVDRLHRLCDRQFNATSFGNP